MTDTLSIQIQKVAQSRIAEVDFDNIAFGKVYSDHMFMADYKNGEWTNLKISPYQNLSLSPANSAIHYGQSIFEGLKAYRSSKNEIILFRPLDNYNRLNKSAQRMCMPEIPEEVFMQGLIELLKLDSNWVPKKVGSSLYIRPFMFATDEFIGIRPADTYKFMIFTCPVGSYYSEPVRVRIETNFSRAYPGGTGAAKCAGNYGGALYPARQAQALGYHQLIWTDASTHQYIEESGTMNVMFVIGDKLITAPSGETILDGITRKSVLALAREWGMNVEERKVSVLEVIEAIKNGSLKEAFGTGTAATIAPIALINHDGNDYTLPALETREFSQKVLKTLNDIRYGAVEDSHGWTVKL